MSTPKSSVEHQVLAATDDAVVVHGDRVRVDRVHADLPHVEARHRFGGVDLPAALGGMLAGLGTLALLGGLLAGAGSFGYQQGLREELPLAGLVSGLVALLVCGLVLGWVAGRSARYDGLRNGVLAGVLLLLLTAGLGALGAKGGEKYDIASNAHLPTWATHGATTGRAIASGLVALAVLLLGSALGGRVGARWHRKVDSTVVNTRDGGVAPYPTETGR
jgi:hypothetical protein